MLNEYFKSITEYQRQRTKQLLYDVRHELGIDAYLFTKKVLLVSIIIHHYQTITHSECWVSYGTILNRYERKYKILSLEEYCHLGGTYFGFKSKIIKQMPITKIEEMVRERCERDFPFLYFT